MADTRAVIDDNRSTSSNSPRLEIDCLSKEDLIKQIKKQVILLQKSKNKCDDLRKQCVDLENELKQERLQKESESSNGKQVQNIIAELNDVSEEKDELKKKLESLQNDFHQITCKYKEGNEQIECMKMKEESMKSAMKCLQEELNRINNQNEELRNGLTELKSSKEEIVIEHTELLKKFEILQEELNHSKDCQNKILVDQEKVNEDNRCLKEKLEEMQDQCSLLKDKLDNLDKINGDLVRQKNQFEEFVMNQKDDLDKEKRFKTEIMLRLQNFSDRGISEENILSTIENVLEDKEQFQQKLEESDSHILHLQMELSRFQQLSSDSLIKELESTVEKLQEDYCVLEAELHNMTVERDKLLFQEERENSDSYEERIKELLLENEDLQVKLEHSEFEVAELQSKLEENELQREQSSDEQNKKQELLSQSVQTENVNSTDAFASSDFKDILSSEINFEDCQNLSDLKIKLQFLLKENSLLKEELESLRTSKFPEGTYNDDGQHNLVMKILESENSVLQNELTSMKNKEVKYKLWLKNILNCSETTLDAWENDGENISLEINNLKNSIEALQSGDKGASSNSENDLEQQLQGAKGELGKLKDIIAQLESQLNNHNSEIEMLQKEKQLLKEEANSNIVELTKLKQEIEELELKLKDKTEEFECMVKESNVDSAKCIQDLQTANELKEELETEIQNLIIQLQHYKTESDKLKLLCKETSNQNIDPQNKEPASTGSNSEIHNVEVGTIKKVDKSVVVFANELVEVESSSSQTDNSCFSDLEKEMKLLEEQKGELIRELENVREQCVNKVKENEKRITEEKNEVILNRDMIIKQLENDLNELNLQLSNVKNQNEAVLLQLDEKNNALNDQNQEIDKLNNECQALLKKIEFFQTLETRTTFVQTDNIDNCSVVNGSSAAVEESNEQHEDDDSERNAQVRENEDRLQKYKAVAIKTKKELAENKQQVITLQLQVDKLILEKREFEEGMTQLKENLTANQVELKELKSVYEDCVSDKTKYKTDLDKALMDLASARAQLTDCKAQNDVLLSQIEILKEEKKRNESLLQMLTDEKGKLLSQVEELSLEGKQAKETQKRLAIELKQERERHQQTSQRLTDLEKEINQLRVMNLEMADYERLVTNLNNQLSECQKKIETLTNDAEQKQEFTGSLQTQLEQTEDQLKKADDRSSKLKALLEKAKKELNDLRRQENEWKTAKAQLVLELETAKQEKEAVKMESANLMGEIQKFQEIIRNMKDSQQRAVTALEYKISSLQEELDRLNTSYEKCQSEYEGYKVRVHSVLKQQKNKSVPNTISQEQLEKERLEKLNEQLTLRMQEMSDQLAAVTLEHEALQEEYDRLLARHNNLHQDLQKREEDWKEMYDQLAEENNAYKSESASVIQQLQEQNNSIAETFKVQLQKQQAEFDRNLENVQRQLSFAEAEVLRIQKDQMKISPIRDDDVFDVINTERQEGEGSESTDPLPGMSNKFVGSVSDLVPLEQLLNQDEKLSETTLSFHEYENVQSQLVSCNKKIEHLSEVLNESEASNMRLIEQVRVLKEEIRRLERNQQREEHAANMEYLKNVILKFLVLQGGDERERLVPVLTMMLRLSPTETSQLNTIAKGGEVDGEAVGSGWGTYLPRWSGLV